MKTYKNFRIDTKYSIGLTNGGKNKNSILPPINVSIECGPFTVNDYITIEEAENHVKDYQAIIDMAKRAQNE